MQQGLLGIDWGSKERVWYDCRRKNVDSVVSFEFRWQTIWKA